MSLSTINLNSVINFCRTHTDLTPLVSVGGIVQEPALSICNDALSDLLTEPNDWWFNSVTVGISDGTSLTSLLVTTPNRQDYIFGGATAFTLGATSSGACISLATSNGITVSGGAVTVNTTQSHRFSVGDTAYLIGVTMTTGTTQAYNSTFSDNGSTSGWSNGWVITAVTSTSFSFAAKTGQNNGDVGGAPGISNYGFLSSASMIEMNNTSSPVHVKPLKTVKDLPVWSRVATPEKIGVVQDRGDGTLLIRCYYVPGTTTWGIGFVYQAKAPLKVSLADNWAPFPDNYQAVYRQAVLYRCYRYLNSPRSEAEFQKLQQEIAKAQGYDDNQQSNVYFEPDTPLITNEWFWGL